MSTTIRTPFPSQTPQVHRGNHTTSGRVETARRVDVPDALDLALEQSHEVKAKVETCADDLAAANEIMKEEIAGGTTMLSAQKTLLAGTTVESKVQECADDLLEVTETLAQGIDDLAQTEIELTESREMLAETQAALANSQEEEKEARRRALHDSMTGLPNRDLFDDRLSHAISLARRHDWTLAVMFLDLDGFKKINDTHGHAAGDSVLMEVARRLSLHSRDEDTVCRNGGDEFLYLLVNPQGQANIERIAGLVAAEIAKPMSVGSRPFVVNVSIGVAVYPVDGVAGDELIRSADSAMYRAKKHESGLVFFDRVEQEAVSA
jgi:diguanylate cyclase (GGDEF)-like protein